MARLFLQHESDVNLCQRVFNESETTRHRVKLYEFDNVVSEPEGHSLTLGMQQHFEWLNRSAYSLPSTAGSKHPADNVPFNFVILYGQANAVKSQLMSVVRVDSFLSRFTQGTSIKFLRVSMFYQG
jgi:hypothetical protein